MAVTWLGSAPYAVAVVAALIVYFLIYPFIVYIWDAKGKNCHGDDPSRQLHNC